MLGEKPLRMPVKVEGSDVVLVNLFRSALCMVAFEGLLLSCCFVHKF